MALYTFKCPDENHEKIDIERSMSDTSKIVVYCKTCGKEMTRDYSKININNIWQGSYNNTRGE